MTWFKTLVLTTVPVNLLILRSVVWSVLVYFVHVIVSLSNLRLVGVSCCPLLSAVTCCCHLSLSHVAAPYLSFLTYLPILRKF
jgi:hypothetical protein